MQFNLKKIIGQICLILFIGLILTSCNFGERVITQEMLEKLEFNDLTITYDGTPHSIYVDNKYEKDGVSVTYVNNEKTKPGTYSVRATIKYSGLQPVIKTASLIIEKAESEIFIESNFTFNLLEEEPKLTYTTSNTTLQELGIKNNSGMEISLSDLTLPGQYNLQVYLKENLYYKQSKPVSIIVNIVTSTLNISFENKEVIADGKNHRLEINGNLPSGYTVEYENNEGILDGTYYAVAKIFDETSTLVEIYRAVLIIENEENQEFNNFLDEFFISYLEGDQLSVNIFCENPQDFGLSHYDPSWYTFEKFTDEDLKDSISVFETLQTELEKFNNAPLNDLQDAIYETIRKFLEYNILYYSIPDAIYMELNYINQFGGYVADFGTYMEAYALRTEQDVEDVIDYIESTKVAFPSYLDYLEIKTLKGYALSDYTIESMMGYLEYLIAQGEEYYLKAILFEKIDKLDFLTQTSKEQYKNEIKKAIKECFVVGVKELYNGLENYLGKLSSADEGYLSKYGENGDNLYCLDLINLLGYDELNVTSYLAELDNAILESIDNVTNIQLEIIVKYNVTSLSQFAEILSSATIKEGTPNEMMEYLIEFAKTIVPELKENPNIVIKNMDEASAMVSNAVAYYMQSALDNTGSEYITLNPVQLEYATPTDVLDTLAHEGYPGHLYAYLYAKELNLSNIATIMTSTAHAEGWATYVQLKLYEYAASLSNDEKFKLVMDYLYANQIASYLIETRIDAGIHLEKWTISDIAKYLQEVGYDPASATDIYNLLIETPNQYAAYGYGKLTFVKFHNEAKEILGIYYDEIEFNAMLLSKGWTDLEILEQTYHNYMKIKCHELGIAFE